MSEPVYCGRIGCEHRLRMHYDDEGACLHRECRCTRFVEPYPQFHFEQESTVNPWQHRHPSVAHFEQLFAFDHLPVRLQAVSRPFAELAVRLLGLLSDGPELAVALRKLIESKDCAVRQAVIKP